MSATTADSLAAFAEACDALNTLGESGAVRRYQREIMNTGRLVIDGLEASASCAFRDNEVGYRFEVAGEPVWLLTQRIADGFPLAALSTLDGHQVRIGQLRHFNADAIAAALPDLSRAERSDPLQSASNRPWLIIGHPNFAHHAWNELSALLSAGEHEVDATVLNEPLGSLSALASNLRIRRQAPLSIAQEIQSQTLVRLGSTRVTRECKRVVLDHAERSASKPARELLTDLRGRPVVWITIRLDKRTCVNLDEFLTCVLEAFDRNIKNCWFVLDGFSYPADYDTNSRYDNLRAGFSRRAAGTGAAIQSLLEGLSPDIRARCRSVNGWDILDAILVAGAACYYVSHAGSMHHKLGWFHETPGFIHSPPSGETAQSLLRWHASMSEGAVVPTGTLPDDVEAVPMMDDSPIRNADYRIRAPQQLAAKIAREAKNSNCLGA